MAIRILSNQNVTSNVIAIQAFRLGTDSLWKLRGNAASAELAFEYSTSSSLSDANIKVIFKPSGDVGIGDNVTPSQKLHVAGNIYSINSGTDGGQIRLANSGGGSNWYWAARTTGLNLGELGVADGNIFIANGGNVGIDTTDQTPEKFNVDGNIIMVGGSTNTGYDRYFKIYGNTQPVNNPNRWAGMAVYNNGGNNVNELAFFTGSGDDARTEKVRIDSGGRVGIGTNDPQSKLQIVDEVSTAINIYSTYNYSLNRNWRIQLNGFGTGNWGGFSILQSTAQDLAPSVPLFGITRTGNVGIGIGASNTAVDHKLHVNGSIKIGNTNNRLVFGTSGGTDRRALEGNVDGTLLQIGEGYSKTTMYSKVGIGTTSPSAKLEVNGALFVGNHTGTVTPTSGIFIEEAAGVETKIQMYTYGGSVFRILGSEIKADIGWGSSQNRSVNFNNTGTGNISVGIGTTSPDYTLHLLKSSGDTEMYINGQNGQSSLRMGLDARNWQIKTAAAPYLWSLNYVGTDFQTLNIITAETTGNVGIGTDSPDAKLEIKATGSTTGLTFKTTDSSGNENFFIQDGGRTGVTYYPFTVGQASGTSAASGARFQVATTAGDFVVLSDGKTGIGTTNPTQLLHVNSTTSNPTGIGLQNSQRYYSVRSNNYSLVFTDETVGTERMRITSGGNLLVGATALSDVGSLTQSHLLEGYSQSAGTGAVGTYNNSGTANCPSLVVLNRDTSTDSSNRFIQFYANVIGGTNTPMGGIVGNGASNVQFASLSDIREKENIKTIESSLNKISKLNPVEFDWKKSGEHINAGFIAQEVEEVFPEYVVENISNEGEEERKGLTGGMTSGIVAHLVKSIQELKAEVEILKNK